MARSSAPSVASGGWGGGGVGLSAMVLSGWRLLINRSPGRRSVGVGKASDESCLPTCFGQTSVVAAGAEFVHRQGVEVDVWSRDESPTRLGTASSRKKSSTKEAVRRKAVLTTSAFREN